MPSSPSSSLSGSADVSDWLREQINAQAGIPEAFRQAGEELLALSSPEIRVRSFQTIAAALEQEHPAEIRQLAERLLTTGHRDEFALAAARTAQAMGDPAAAERHLKTLPSASSPRRRLEQRWHCEALWAEVQPLLNRYIREPKRTNTPPELLEALARLVDAAVESVREESRAAFYTDASRALEEILALSEPIGRAAARPPRDLLWLLQRLRLMKRPDSAPGRLALQRALKRAQGLKAQLHATSGWLRDGLRNLPAESLSGRREPTGSRNVLYLTFGSLPHDTNGNTSRTHGLLSAMTAEGWNVRGITRPGFPQALRDELHSATTPQPGGEAWENSYRYEDVLYTNLRHAEAKAHAYDAGWKFRTLVDAATALARRDRPALIHGASNHLIGAAAIHAAERLGLPGIYELRGMWSLDYAAKNPDFLQSPEHEQMEAMEIDVARRAAHLFVISQGLHHFLTGRGISAEKITLLPNGVDPERFRPGPPSPELAARLGLPKRPLIGFVGTLSHYEGITTLIDALRLLKERQPAGSFGALIIGGGSAGEAARERIHTSGLEEIVTLLPGVPFSEVPHYLRLIDIIAIPRPGYEICERVTPIKPFEAMAMERTVVASSVGGLTEIITHNETGLIFEKDNPEALARTLGEALADAPLRHRLGKAAREFVLQQHDWRNIVRRSITPVYHRLAGREIALPGLPSSTLS